MSIAQLVRTPMQSFPKNSPFHALSIASHAPLTQQQRKLCPQCQKSCKYFCYRCLWVPEGLELPQVQLPLRLELIKHEQELDSKSTAIHAKLLSPTQTTIHDFHKASPASSPLATQILTSPPGSFVILFPDEEAVRLEELEPEELRAIEAVIVIDGTWSQAAAINRCEPFTRLRKIRIDEGLRTVFWRYQDLGENCLSTIEAIYYFMCEAERVKSEGRDGLDGVVDGRKCLDGVVDKAFDGDGRDAPSNEKTDSTLTHSNLDNLLYFFSFFYHLIQDSYLSNPERKYTTKHRPDYIKREERLDGDE